MAYLVEDPSVRGRVSEEVFEKVLTQVLTMLEERYEGEFLVCSVSRTSTSNRLRKFDFSGIDFIVKYQYRGRSYIALFQVKSSECGVRVFREKYAHFAEMICAINMSPERSLDELISEVESYITWIQVNHIDFRPLLFRLRHSSQRVVDFVQDGRKIRALHKKRLERIRVREDYLEAYDDLDQYYEGGCYD
jgi:hypothetical protein